LITITKNKKSWLFLPVCFLLFSCSKNSDPLISFQNGEYEKAYRIWIVQAEEGDPDAQNYIGLLYYLGAGVNRDYGLARAWYEKSAAQGNADAMFNLGLLYDRGKGVEYDYINAYGWFYAAYLMGNPKGKPYIDDLASKLTANKKSAGMRLGEQRTLSFRVSRSLDQ